MSKDVLFSHYSAGVSYDDERLVELDEDYPLLDQAFDDTERGWAGHPASNDDRLLQERPPHWD